MKKQKTTTGFMRIVEQTPEEEMAMYMKCKKRELCQMLIQCNKILNSQQVGTAIPFETTVAGIARSVNPYDTRSVRHGHDKFKRLRK